MALPMARLYCMYNDFVCQFTGVQQKFREIVAESVNAYCQANRDMCRIVYTRRRYEIKFVTLN